MILLIDNYDSFSYNLVQYLGELSEQVQVKRHDEIDLASIADLQPQHIVLSPGPGNTSLKKLYEKFTRTNAYSHCLSNRGY